MGEQVVGQQHRLGPLQVGVAGQVRSPAASARPSSTSCSVDDRSATASSSRLHHSRRSVATWSLRLRAVCSLAPAGPASSVTRRSTAVWMSSSDWANANVPSAISVVDGVERGEHGVALGLGEQPDAARGRVRAPASRRCRRATAGDRTAGWPCRPSARRPGRPRSGRATASSAVARSASLRRSSPASSRSGRPATSPSRRRRPRTASCRRRRRCRAGRRWPLRSSAEATTWAQPGRRAHDHQVAGDGDLGDPLAHHPPQLVERRDAVGLDRRGRRRRSARPARGP